eukprot:2026521-Prymnesium_polylepis.1
MKDTDGPAGKRSKKLVIGCYVDDLFAAYSHDDVMNNHSITSSRRLYSHLGTSRTRALRAICSTLRSSARTILADFFTKPLVGDVFFQG